jgi:MoaA/NifB/PqqE/SkfB family radical SAM enzyme
MNWVRRSIFLLRAFIAVTRTRFVTHRPFLLSHLVTSRCNCQCPVCLWRGSAEYELSTEQVFSIYRDAKKNGFAALALWGGEPLIREDIVRIIQSAHRMGFVTLLVTNGYRLSELAMDISPSLQGLIVSIDFPSEKHDEFRGYPGLFRKAVDGIRAAQRANPDMKLSINCVLTRLNGNEVKGMISLADKLGVSITFESMNTQMPFSTCDVSSFKLSAEDEGEIFRQIRHYKVQGHRINNSFAYLDTFISGKRKYECHSLEVSLFVKPNGDVLTCIGREPLANLTEVPIGKLLKSSRYREHQKVSRRCCICNDYGTVECSYIWKLKPRAILDLASTFLSQ